MTEHLGSQTLVLIERTRVKHGEFRDGASRRFEGCSVQPDGSAEADGGLTNSSRWTVYVPGGDFPRQTENVVLWQGIELQVDGKMQVHYDDLTGEALHTTGKLKEWEA